MNTVQLFNTNGEVLEVRQFNTERDAERFAFNVKGMTYAGELITKTKIIWADGSAEEYEH